MIKTVSQIKDEWADREAIRDCLARYSRAIDRCDMDLLRTVYWPEAVDKHTGVEVTVEEFIAWSAPRLRLMQHSVHMMGNILIQLDGDKAAAESYGWSVCVISGNDELSDTGKREVFICGRYLDKFEKRNDEWRVAERMIVHDWFRETYETGDWKKGPWEMKDLELGTFMPEDPSYGWLGL